MVKVVMKLMGLGRLTLSFASIRNPRYEGFCQEDGEGCLGVL